MAMGCQRCPIHRPMVDCPPARTYLLTKAQQRNQLDAKLHCSNRVSRRKPSASISEFKRENCLTHVDVINTRTIGLSECAGSRRSISKTDVAYCEINSARPEVSKDSTGESEGDGGASKGPTDIATKVMTNEMHSSAHRHQTVTQSWRDNKVEAKPSVSTTTAFCKMSLKHTFQPLASVTT